MVIGFAVVHENLQPNSFVYTFEWALSKYVYSEVGTLVFTV